jgi:hypothetical protein
MSVVSGKSMDSAPAGTVTDAAGPAASIRCLLYDIYLYSIMVIECTYRRFPTDDQHRWAYEHLTGALAALEGPRARTG